MMDQDVKEPAAEFPQIIGVLRDTPVPGEREAAAVGALNGPTRGLGPGRKRWDRRGVGQHIRVANVSVGATTLDGRAAKRKNIRTGLAQGGAKPGDGAWPGGIGNLAGIAPARGERALRRTPGDVREHVTRAAD